MNDQCPAITDTKSIPLQNMTQQIVDISENQLYLKYPEVLQTLLRCHSRFAAFREQNPQMGKKELDAVVDEHHIIWATDDYAAFGEGFEFSDQITAEKVTGEHGSVIRPRALKTIEEQTRRVKDKAEVFTPSWVCNAQNNLIDEAWFGRKDVFNVESLDADGQHVWEATDGPIQFPEGKTGEDYVKDVRLEMCCGEAPYIASRYDTVTGDYIDVNKRIGLLDRKLRVISENTDDPKAWIDAARLALESTYGFEWQGDNLLLAREAVLFTVLDFYEAKFGKELTRLDTLKGLAYRISWNFWQMDGLKYVVPESCGLRPDPQPSLFDEPTMIPCQGCKNGNPAEHNGIKCRIRDWRYSGKDPRKARPYFYTLISNPNK